MILQHIKKIIFFWASMKVANSNSCNKSLSQLGSNLIIDGIEIERKNRYKKTL